MEFQKNVKWIELNWIELKWIEVKWIEVKWSEVKWSEVKWSSGVSRKIDQGKNAKYEQTQIHRNSTRSHTKNYLFMGLQKEL